MLRFLLVGGVNTVFGYSIFALCYLASGNHDLALVVSVCLGVIFNFFAIGKVVFRTIPKGRFWLFCVNYGIALLVNSLMLNGLVYLGIDALVGQIICLPAFVAISYSLNAHFVFRRAASESRPSLAPGSDLSAQ